MDETVVFVFLKTIRGYLGGYPLFYEAYSSPFMLGDDLNLIEFARYTHLFAPIMCIKWSSCFLAIENN